MRWLGLFFNKNLQFDKHIEIMSEQGETAVNALGILGNTVRGMSIRDMRMAYLMTVRPILTYGAVVWYKGDKQKGLIKKLELIQN